MNRINRVTSILIQLQSKKIIPAKEIAQRYNISLRTVYRDIRTLEEAGIPIGSEAGKGYFLVEGFLLPPVMFTAAEVGALITAGKFLNCHGDESFIKDFDSAMYKIKSILKHGEKNYAQELENSIIVQRMADAMGVNYSPLITRLKELDLFDKRPIEEYLSTFRSGGELA